MTATQIAARLAERAEDVCHHLLPNGRRVAQDWCCGSTAGEPGSSLKIRLSGTKTGVWADFSGTPDDRGDLIGLWQKTRGATLAEACLAALDWLGLPPEVRNVNRPKPESKPPSATWLRLQAAMRPLTDAEMDALARLRRIPVIAGLKLATAAGQLWYADVFDDGTTHPAWLITDSGRRAAQARRLDGQLWTHIKSKSKTIKDCDARWPVGVADVRTPEIMLTEGGPDFLAAWHFLWAQGRTGRTSPVTMLGASNPIHAEALPLFRDKRVWIFPHIDENQAGEKAAHRWSAQLRTVNADPVAYDFRRHGVKDLNDLIGVVQAFEEAEA